MNVYQKKSVLIEASDPITTDNIDQIATWCNGTRTRDPEMDHDGWTLGDLHISIRTTEGAVKAHLGDRVIRGVEGRFYPCKPDTFNICYQQPGKNPAVLTLQTALVEMMVHYIFLGGHNDDKVMRNAVEALKETSQ